jgi:hypothetical protein
MTFGPVHAVAAEIAMSWPCRFLTALAVALLLLGAAGAQEKPKPPVTVALRLSVKELDPRAPGDASLKVVVRNHGRAAVKVPTVYTAGFDRAIILKGGSGPWGLWLVSWGEPGQTQRYKSLAPGKEVVVFEAPLKEILLDPIKRKTAKAAWTWEA